MMMELRCISFDSYIKPQLHYLHDAPRTGCISFDSYIKPQLWSLSSPARYVVYLLIPTSNHNSKGVRRAVSVVVYLLIPTSNHNTTATNC